jgi:hypothetical protein
MYPPVVSVAGFANVDRGMFRAVSNLTKKLKCRKKQVRLVLICKSVKINLQIRGGGSVPVRLDRLVYCTGTFIHISVRLGKVGKHQLDATITVLLISKISSICFGQTFARLQERKTEIFTTYGIMSC